MGKRVKVSEKQVVAFLNLFERPPALSTGASHRRNLARLRPDSNDAAAPLRHRDASSANDFCNLYTGCSNVPRRKGAEVFLPPGGPVLFFQKKQFFLPYFSFT
jgi:hypothetical protein